MSKIMDYSFLLQEMFGNNSSMGLMNPIKISDLSSKSVITQLKAAGIDTGSKQYQAVMQSMMANSRGVGYTNIQAIKNRMSRYDKDGDYVDPVTGLAGLSVNEKNIASKNKIISIPESSRDEMFESTKRDFLRENGVANGDTTNRSAVYLNLYRKMKKNDRLAAGNTLRQYERAYTQAFVEAVKSADPSWEIGKPIPYGALDNIKREDIDSLLSVSGNKLVKKSIDVQI
ncbi:MAG: DUF3879 family protein [Lachnospiraceae bacterium]|nr:DUF3879 family protein [Lachnospiraceae bacterium]